MDCHLFKLLIQKYHDGELDRAVRAEFETHLAGCKECRELESYYSEAFSALGDMIVYQPSEAFNNRVMSEVNVRKYKKSFIPLTLSRISRRVNLLPAYVRVTGSLAVAFALFMYIFRPVFLYVLSAGATLIDFTVALADISKRSRTIIDIILNYFRSDNGFVLAAVILFRKIKEIIAQVPIGYFVTVFVLACFIVFIIARISRSTWKKGESHVVFI